MGNLFSKRLWNRDFVLNLQVCTIVMFPNSILNDRIGRKKLSAPRWRCLNIDLRR